LLDAVLFGRHVVSCSVDSSLVVWSVIESHGRSANKAAVLVTERRPTPACLCSGWIMTTSRRRWVGWCDGVSRQTSEHDLLYIVIVIRSSLA